VVTLAKQNPERAWLGEVASVALVQACQDARRAYRNWFDSLSGRRKGRKVGRPAFRRKHRRQSIRLTRNGFALRGERLYVASLVVTSDGEIIGNPRFLRAKERKLARAQRALSRKRSDTMHDRDVNAAKNVLALGRRESLNARGGNVRPGLVPADPVETGTHRSAA
jgi:transposase